MLHIQVSRQLTWTNVKRLTLFIFRRSVHFTNIIPKRFIVKILKVFGNTLKCSRYIFKRIRRQKNETIDTFEKSLRYYIRGV